MIVKEKQKIIKIQTSIRREMENSMRDIHMGIINSNNFMKSHVSDKDLDNAFYFGIPKSVEFEFKIHMLVNNNIEYESDIDHFDELVVKFKVPIKES
jgi:hypothetical protein